MVFSLTKLPSTKLGVEINEFQIVLWLFEGQPFRNRAQTIPYVSFLEHEWMKYERLYRWHLRRPMPNALIDVAWFGFRTTSCCWQDDNIVYVAAFTWILGEENLSISRKCIVWSSQVLDQKGLVSSLIVLEHESYLVSPPGERLWGSWNIPSDPRPNKGESHRNSPRPLFWDVKIYSKKWSCQCIKPCIE